jgi:hypothetical protein
VQVIANQSIERRHQDLALPVNLSRAALGIEQLQRVVHAIADLAGCPTDDAIHETGNPRRRFVAGLGERTRQPRHIVMQVFEQVGGRQRSIHRQAVVRPQIAGLDWKVLAHRQQLETRHMNAAGSIGML